MIEELLAAVPMFRNLGPDDLARLAESATVLDEPQGTRLFACGDPADCLFVVASGGVEIRIPASQVEPEKTIELGPGAFFGEMGLLRARSRMADATVTSDARLVRIGQQEFDELMASEAPLSAKIMRTYLDRLAAARTAEEAARRAADDPHSLVFLSTGGREGASFLAANLAIKVRDLSERPVLLIDMHRTAPTLHKYFGVAAGNGLERLLTRGNPGPDDIRRFVTSTTAGVDLLTGVGNAFEDPGAESRLQALLAAAGATHQFRIADCGPWPGPCEEALARYSDVSYVVFEPGGPAIRRARGVGEALRRLGLEGRVRFVLNKAAAGGDSESIEFELGDPILGIVEADQGAVAAAEAAGEPVVRRAPKARVSAQVTRLARQILSLPAEPEGLLSSLGIWNLFR